VRAYQAVYPIATMCRVLGVSTSGYYAWRDRPPSARSQADLLLADRIEALHRQSRCTYGRPRIQADLREVGIRVGDKRVARLMRARRLHGASRRKFVITTVREETAAPAPDLVKRNFTAAAPNRLWVADFTYIPTQVGFMFLAVVLDVFSRRVVGWSMAAHRRTALVADALAMAVARRRPAGVIHHSDHGSQYTSIVFGQRCKDAGVIPSMGTVGDCYDNAMCESFFATLECELLDRHRFTSHREAALAIFDYIEGFYNTIRRHTALGLISPVEFERRKSHAA
jgi:putative transposase